MSVTIKAYKNKFQSLIQSFICWFKKQINNKMNDKIVYNTLGHFAADFLLRLIPIFVKQPRIHLVSAYRKIIEIVIITLFFIFELNAYADSSSIKCILVYAASDASETTSNACNSIMKSKPMLFNALQKTHNINGIIRSYGLEDSPKDRSKWDRQALNHLVIVGTPLEGEVAERTQGLTFGINTEKKELYRLGAGRFAGDVGSVETTFNPYLYSNKFDDNPYSTLLVRISGTTPQGVALAAEAFSKGMLNGIVLGDNSLRIETTILDQTILNDYPPLLPLCLSNETDRLIMAGWSQCPENEYRACLDNGVENEPSRIWRIKYLRKGCLDDVSGAAWVNSPHIMAWGNAVTVVKFDNEADAFKMYKGVHANNKSASGKVADTNSFIVPMLVDGIVDKSIGRIVFWCQGHYLVMSSLPDWANIEVYMALKNLENQ